MDIEILKEHDLYVLRDVVSGLEEEQSIDPVIARQFEKVIDEAIARQSVTSEDVAEAIEWVTNTRHRNQYMSGDWTAPMGNHINRTIQDTIITALQACQPWVSVQDRLPENGKHILLCCEIRPSGKRYVCDGYYAQEKSIASGYSDECSNEYDEETDEYYLTEGYYEIIKNWGDYSSIAIDDFVVAWMPLPEPPKG